ncbi:hypothetical protein PHLGIDRAFT_76886 [Phlebiopsis gigantea 11061_1 CR5-6]|uniref:Uncharacterized protein n=1 Tax=Phlebiopsis gigantea (strain 11061_1 CR5-6) TaxID=745531 RepID=A0A0C3S641_PHLG1|nr:hypothetical protein PHLGIDRAFT_76886 [Phlebiopsis gigantea 11061_1 CR5-6]
MDGQVVLEDPPDESETQKGHGCRCIPPPPGNKSKRRNLVVCIDGTANQFGSKNTHVLELYRRLVADETQLTYYDSGIGTYVPSSNRITRMKQGLENTFAQGVALHHERITLRAYQWLSENYNPGDRIYLLGFSRGAYQVRIISGMIKTVGLLRKGNNNQIAFAYQFYLDMMEDTQAGKKSDLEATAKLCEEFHQTLCNRGVTVHFVGVWDTVSSIGFKRGSAFPETSNGMLHVCVFRHALALHELRVKFLPEYASGGAGPQGDVGNVKEVWFAGSHSDIGGGNTKTEHSILYASPPLRWMMYEAIEHDLRIEPYRAVQSPVEHHPSMTWTWGIFELFPWKRLSYGQKKDPVIRYPLHWFEGRFIQAGQRIHESAVDYLGKPTSTRTKAKFLGKDSLWLLVQDHIADIKAQTCGLIIEKDYKSKAIKDIISGLITARSTGSPITDKLRSTLRLLLTKRKSNINRLLDVLRQASLESDDKQQRTDLDVIYKVLAVFILRPEGLPIRPFLYRWIRFSDSVTRTKIMRTFSFISGHTDTIQSVAYSPTGHVITSGSLDGTVRLWNAVTGQPIAKKLELRRNRVNSVAFSPDGRRVAVSSSDHAVWLFRVDNDTLVSEGTQLFNHDHDVRSVTFSPDGTLLAFGSSDKTIRIHDADTGNAVGKQLCGHEDIVCSVAFSSDEGERLRIASGSYDCTVRIWNVSTAQEMCVLRGHSDIVSTVAFSRITGYVVSGSKDHQVMLWDWEADQENPIGTLEGHSDDVNSVAVSPDGRYIASGSDDRTVRLWNAETGEAIGEPLKGHTTIVLSVAFSLDSLNVVSGSAELMIWGVPLQRSGERSRRSYASLCVVS